MPGSESRLPTTRPAELPTRYSSSSDRQAARRFRELLDHVSDGILVHRDFRPLYVNHAWAERHGLTIDRVMQLGSILELVDGQHQQRFAQDTQRCLSAAAGQVHTRYEPRDIDGQRTMLSAVLRRLEWDGSPAIQVHLPATDARLSANSPHAATTGHATTGHATTGHATTGHATTGDTATGDTATATADRDDELEQRVHERTLELERRELELEAANRQLAREKYLLNILVDNIPDPVFFKDLDSRFMVANRAMAHDAGLSHPSDLIGKTDADIWTGDLPAQSLADERQIIETGIPIINKEEQPTVADGEARWVLVTKMPLRDEQGQTIGTFGVAREITELKQAELELRSARDAAEAASRAKSDFLANMSHEIRTPLNAVIGLTELVLDSQLTRTQREYLAIVRESGESLLTVINDILDFSKIEAGKLRLDEIGFDLSDCLGNTMKTLAYRAHTKGVELALRIAPDVPEGLLGDPDRLRQIIVNLVGNAVKFTDQGEAVLDVVLKSQTDTSVELEFTVIDTGQGIPADKLSHIFEAFEQADTSTTRRHGGTGLGLAISARLVELMGGRIWVESELGAGSRFHFTARFTLHDEPRSQPVSSLRGLRLLIVDDNHTNRRILQEILHRQGALTDSVESVAEAIRFLASADQLQPPVSMVLSDVHMPDRDGYELVRHIRAEQDLRELPIILLTSGGEADDVRQLERLAIDRFLIKPVRRSELLDAILQLAPGASTTDISITAPETSAGGSRPLRILLAEDSMTNQILATRLLEKWGHAVDVAVNGLEAVEKAMLLDFDMVLMDVQMPELDGIQAAREIRNREGDSGQHIPIIALTAHAMTGDRDRCLAAGMDAYVTKPIRRADLDAAIMRLIPD